MYLLTKIILKSPRHIQHNKEINKTFMRIFGQTITTYQHGFATPEIRLCAGNILLEI